MFLDKAQLLASKLIPAFNTPSGLPKSQISLGSGQTENFGWTNGASVLAEIGTVQVEFSYLSHHTGVSVYFEKAQRVIDHLERVANKAPYPYLFPIFLNTQSGDFTTDKITWGAMGDSTYEYFLKMWILTKNDAKYHKQRQVYQKLYENSVENMRTNLIFTDGEGLTYIADRNGRNSIDYKMDHLVCFAPGMLALGSSVGIVDPNLASKHLDLAKLLMETCYRMYTKQPTGVAPEYVRFTPRSSMVPGEYAYHLRPETVESLFVLYRITHNEMYREWGWAIFTAIERSCRVDRGGYAGLTNINDPKSKDNKMESFFLAETLKYLYLLYSDDSVIPLDKYVFNTECHPVSVF